MLHRPGPARSPSLVTWPTRTTGTPVDLASRVSRSTHALTWARLPTPGDPSSQTVCMESTTARAGRWCSMAASMAATSLPARARRFSGTGPMRAARPLTSVNDSSADANSTSPPAAAADARTWKRRVDLPTRVARRPGSPNRRRSRPPAPDPPRRCRWASAGRRSRRPGGGDRSRPAGGMAPAGRADRVFHRRQCGQRPTHRRARPHTMHRWIPIGRAISAPKRGVSARLPP